MRLTAVQELQDFAEQLQHAGAGIKALNLAASPHMLHSQDYELDIVRVGAALYGQQETVPGTRSAARWLTRIATLKKVGSSPPDTCCKANICVVSEAGQPTKTRAVHQ